MPAKKSAKRAVLEGVPGVDYMQDGFCPFASSLRSVLVSQGQRVSTREIMALSGVGVRKSW